MPDKSPPHNRYGSWKGVLFFAYGAGSVLGIIVLTHLLNKAFPTILGLEQELWWLAVVCFMFFNIAGIIISLDITLTSNNIQDKTIGLLSFLLNIAPLTALAYYIITTDFTTNL